MAIFYNCLTTSYHFHRLQVENCGNDSRLVVNEDDNGKFRPKRVEALNFFRKTLEAKGFFQFEIIINVLLSSFQFI